MAGKTQDYIIRIRAENEQLKRKLKDTRGRLKNHNTKVGMLAKQAMSSLGIFFGAGAVLQGIRTVTEAYDKQAKALAQVKTGIEATGGVAGKTFEELERMAADLQKTTLFGDEEILQSATAQILTFTNIAGEAFDRTQKAALDVSTRIGQDLTSTTIMLGKALNDPVANLGALGRSGIQFSKSQKELIKTLADTNRIAEAQDIILTELEKQYGGSAEAAAKAGTGGWKQLSNTVGDLQENLGRVLIEGQSTNDLLKGMTKSVQYLNDNFDTIATNTGNFLQFLYDVNLPLRAFVEYNKTLLGLFKDPEYIPSGQFDMPKPDTAGVEVIVDALDKVKERSEAAKKEIMALATSFESLGAVSVLPEISTSLVGVGDDNPILNNLRLQFEAARAEAKMQTDALNAILEDGLASGIAGFADGLATGGMEDAFQNLFNVIGGGLQTLGKALIAFGVSMDAFKKAFSNPLVAIAAGAAAVAAGALVKNAASSLSAVGGGGGTSGGGGGRGVSNVGRQEFNFKMESIVKGDDIVYVYDKVKNRNARINGS